MNFNLIYNKEKKVAEIDISGLIGESWFDEETVTFEGVRNQLREIDADEIVLNIRSFGGDVDHAFGIYNILKGHKAFVTANIIGMTASAGTIVAMSADWVNMSDNAEFLIHNSWTVTMGNADEHRKGAKVLDDIDNSLIKIYKKKTGKRDNTIRDLMKEEKWLNAQESKDFGFIDKITEASKIAASMAKDPAYSKFIKNKKMDNNTLLEEIKNIFAPVMNLVKGKDEKETDKIINDKAVEIRDFYAEKLLKSEELEKENKEKIENMSKDVESKEAEIVAKNTEIETLQAANKVLDEKIKKLEGKPSGDAPSNDAGTRETPKPKTMMDELAAKLQNRYK